MFVTSVRFRLAWVLVAALGVCLAGGISGAKGWKGALPGVTTRKQVVEKFGKPFKDFSRGGKLSNALSYQGDQTIEGSLEADFYFDKNDVLFRVDVFPAREVTVKQIKRIFGKKYIERVTKKGFTFFDYNQLGMVVFFDKDDGFVKSFMFTEPEQPAKHGGKK